MFIFLDTETGGIGPDYSLLSSYFLATDNDFNKVDELSLLTKPDDGIYHVCGDAMEVNNIDLKTHDKQAITYKEAGTKLYDWLRKLSNDGKDKLIVVGHNVAGDRNKVCECLISRGTWDKFTSYRLRDTQTIACFLIDCGIIPNSVSGSLTSLCEYYEINQHAGEDDDYGFHTAKFDTEMTMKVYKKLVERIIKLNTTRFLY